MTPTGPTRVGRRARPAAARRVGFFGLLGQGNLGNDGSMEAVLAYLRAEILMTEGRSDVFGTEEACKLCG